MNGSLFAMWVLVQAPFSSPTEALRAILDAAADAPDAVAFLKSKGRPGLWLLNDRAKSESGARRGRILEAMGHFQSDESEFALRKALKTDDLDARIGAIRGLGHLKNKKLGGVLAAEASSPEPKIREAALEAMLEIGPEMAARAWELFGDEDPNVRAVGLAFIARQGARRPLLRAVDLALSDKAPAVVVRGLELAKDLKEESLAAKIWAHAGSPAPEIGRAALDAYAALWPGNAGERLSELLSAASTNPDTVRHAVAILRGRRTSAAAAAVANGAVAGSPERRALVLEAFLSGAREEDYVEVVRLLTSPNTRARQFAEDVLSRAGEPAENAALRALGTNDPLLRQAVERVLAGRQNKEGVATKLLAGAKTGPVPERAGVITFLGELADPAVLPEVMRLRSDPVLEIRVAAITALGGFRGAEVDAALSESLADPDLRLRLAALDALAKIRTRTRQTTMAGALEDPDSRVRLRAIQLLSAPSDSEILQKLHARVLEGRGAEREEAIKAISASRLNEAAQLMIELVTHRDRSVRAAALQIVDRQ